MRRSLSLLILAAFVCATPSAEVTLPAKMSVKPGRLFKLEAKTDGKMPVKWINVHESLDLIPDSSGKWVILLGTVPGNYKVVAYTADEKGPSEPAYCEVKVEGVVPPAPTPTPTPPGPTPPEPQPPVPPQPDQEAPIKAEGFRVMILYESNDLAKLSSAQQAVLYSATIRNYLNEKCAPNSKNSRDWYILDQNADVSKLDEHWGAVVKRPRTSLPWIIVSNGKTGYEGPLPGNVEEASKLLKKYAEK